MDAAALRPDLILGSWGRIVAYDLEGDSLVRGYGQGKASRAKVNASVSSPR